MSEEKPVILVVDDEDLVRRIVCRALAETAQVLDVNSADEAMEAIKANLGIQLIITDIRMPGGSGVKLHLDATAAGYQGPWLVMTGQASDAELGYFEKQKPQPPAVLTKPFSLAVLRKAVEEALVC